MPFNYVNNDELTMEIDRSKKRLCSDCDNPRYWDADWVADSLDDIDASMIGDVVRVMDGSHIPEDLLQPFRVKFKPFRHYVVADDGKGGPDPKEVVRSHWKGTIEDGFPSHDHAPITDRLGQMLLAIVKGFHRQSSWAHLSWREDLEDAAREAALKGCLKVDTDREDCNAFSYISRTVQNAAIRENRKVIRRWHHAQAEIIEKQAELNQQIAES